MENYYSDTRVLLALEKSGEELMDVLTFIKEINFEIKDNLGFDVLWDSLSGRRCVHVHTSLLEWFGYEEELPLLQFILGKLRPNVRLLQKS